MMSSELVNVHKLIEAANDANRSYLFYGPPGSGKTTLAANHPSKRKLWLDMDQKLPEMTVLPHREAVQVWTPNEPLGNPERIEIPWSPDPKNVGAGTIPARKPLGYERLVQVTNELLKAARLPEGLPYDLVVLDTLTAVGDHWTRLLMYTHRVSFMTERLWGIYLAGMMEYLNGFLTLPCERIVLCHDKRRTDEDTKQEVVRPSVAGQMGDNLVRFFTEAWYMKGRERSGKYKVQTITAEGIAARTSGSLEPEVLAGPELFTR
jgi:DNA polymerase III delta prime subunit